MCIALAKAPEAILEKERLQICYLNNNDGCGFAFSKDGKLFVQKGFPDFESFWEAFNPIQNGNRCLIHFRVASAGNKEASNCHPFLVTPDLAIIHNGTIQDYNEKDNPKSDTALFVENILEELVALVGPKFFLSPIIQYLILKTIGDSKMVFLDADGDFSIVNESKGITEDGVWYSNDSYKALKKKEVSKSDKSNHIKDSTPFVNNFGGQGQQRFGYLLCDGDGHLLTSTEIHRQVKSRKGRKLKLLVKDGIILKVALGPDGLPKIDQKSDQGLEGLELWLQTHPNYDKPEILDAEIVPAEYAG